MKKKPLQSQIEKVELVNFRGTHKIDLSPQLAQLEFYESIYEPLQQAVLTVYDPIGLFNNFPLLGEELILVTFKNTPKEQIYKQIQNQFSYEPDSSMVTLAYVIDEISSVTPSDKNREVSYTMKLSSFVNFVNNQISVQKAYNGILSEIAEKLFIEYITTPLNNIKSNGFQYALMETSTLYYTLRNFDETFGDDYGTIIIPNLHPIEALKWLADMAVPKNPKRENIVLFWGAMDGFHFQSLQSLVKKEKQREFVYYSDYEIVNKLSEEEKDNAITNIVMNNRILVDTKTVMGYYQNTLMEINMMEQQYKFRKTEFEDMGDTLEENKKYNTQEYIDEVKIKENDRRGGSTWEKSNRVHYIMNNRSGTDVVTPLNNFEENWGNKVRTAAAFGQVDLHITVPGDINIAAGDVIEVHIPKMEGFNAGDGNTEDKFISGRYLVTEVKNVFLTTSNIHSTVLRINKDSFLTDPDSVEFKYEVTGDTTIDKVKNIIP